MSETHLDGYDNLLEEFGRRLDAAALRRDAGRRSRRRAGAGVLALGGIGAGALVLAGLGGGGKLDVVSQARAALAPTGEIVHLVTTSHFETPGGSNSEANPPWITEQWSTSGPPRWRASQTVPTPTTTPDGQPVGDLHGLVTGPMQFSYANGTTESYFQQTNTLDVTSGYSDSGSQAAPAEPGSLGVDPVAQVRSMLEAGRLHDAGSGTVNGHAVRRLVGEVAQGASSSRAVEYDVDPSTYAPVRVTVEIFRAGEAEDSSVPSVIEVVDVDTYEELPLNSDTASLLSIQTTGTPTVEHHQASESDGSAAAVARR